MDYVASGATFSFNDTVGPRTKAEGYVKALNDRGAKVMGGGVSGCDHAVHGASEPEGGQRRI